MYWIALVLVILGQAPTNATPMGYADNYLMGKPDSPVRIEVFSDLQCPSCRTFYLFTITNLLQEYSAGNKVAVIFRDFPLPSHVLARSATRYVVAAKSLGHEKWLKVIEELYTYQAEWSYDGKIEPVLSRILAPSQIQSLTAKLSDPEIEKAIDHEVALGQQRKVDSTPTVFVTMGGKEQRLVGGLTFPVLKQFIDRSLK